MKSGRSQLLPSPDQTWVHAVDSKASLLLALETCTNDDNSNRERITAIETDVVMGYCSTTSEAADEMIPIMAHPPSNRSDLSMTDFLDMISHQQQRDEEGENNNSRIVTKVIKFDFKELAPVEPTLKAIVDKGLQTGPQSAIFLNADILPGPGCRGEGAVTIPASTFLETCLKYIHQANTNILPNTTRTTRFAFSLGFKVDYTDSTGYTADDVQAMSDLISSYQLLPDNSTTGSNIATNGQVGVVLALNARQLVKSLHKFDSIMKYFPDLEILVWTGKGEFPIPKSSMKAIADHFGTVLGMEDRIGFDCQVTDGYWAGVTNDLLVTSFGHIKRVFTTLTHYYGDPNCYNIRGPGILQALGTPSI